MHVVGHQGPRLGQGSRTTTEQTVEHAHPAEPGHDADGNGHVAEPCFGTWLGDDGTELAYARVDLLPVCGRVMVFLHGIGSYGALYYHMAEGLAGSVDAVYFPDMRGHGRSGGRRGDLVSRQQVLSDVAHIIKAVQEQHPEDTVVLAGESMGGLFALAYAAESPDSVDGLILAAPAVKLNTRRLRTRDSIRRGWEGLMGGAGAAPGGGIPITGGLEGEEPRDPAFVEMTISDPLVLQSVSLRYLLTLWGFLFNWSSRYPSRLSHITPVSAERVARKGIRNVAGGLAKRTEGPLPMLVLHGGADVVIDKRATRRLADAVPGAVYVEFPDAWHNLFSDPDSDEVLGVIRVWLEAVEPGQRPCADPREG